MSLRQYGTVRTNYLIRLKLYIFYFRWFDFKSSSSSKNNNEAKSKTIGKLFNYHYIKVMGRMCVCLSIPKDKANR